MAQSPEHSVWETWLAKTDVQGGYCDRGKIDCEWRREGSEESE